ncbi:MAG: aminoacyltransferase [Actinomycetota bacterium]|nr:aminoacyltransferase [Actinomycetota bacterium]
MHAAGTEVVTSRDDWDAEVLGLGGHPLQLWGWGEVKAAGAWTPHRLRVTRDGQVLGVAQVLVRRLPAPFGRLSYVPRGPVVLGDADAETPADLPERRAAVLAAVADWCRENVGGVGVSFEPDWEHGTAPEVSGLVEASETVLVPTTVILDLTRSPDELLAAMDRSPRRDIRKAGRDGMDLRRAQSDDDVRAVLEVYRETAERAGFALHSDEYYLSVHRELGERSVLVAAYEHDAPVCFSWCVNSGRTSFQLYGGSNDAGRRLRATPAVYWRTVEIAQEAGLTRFDFNGLLNDGISAFKRSLASHEDALVGTLDVPFSWRYGLWVRALPAAKRVLRAVRGIRRPGSS